MTVRNDIAAWAVLFFVSTNLIGFVMRGILWSPPHIEAPMNASPNFSVTKFDLRIGNGAMTLLSILATVACLFALFYFWNVWLALAALILMATRLPDLMWRYAPTSALRDRTPRKVGSMSQ